MALHYPIHLGLAYLFLCGYMCRTFFLWATLPGAVGVIFSGFIFSNFMQSNILEGRDDLQGLAFFLVLLTAGIEINLKDLRTQVLVYATVPATLELIGLAAYAVRFMDYTWVEAVVMGNVLFCLGDGLVIPRMGEFTRQFPGHPLPRFVFMFAPLEASFALTLFGVLTGLAEPKKEPPSNMVVLVIANTVRILATLCFGACLGSAAGYLIPLRTKATLKGRQLFTGADVEAYLMMVATALFGFGVGAGEGGQAVVPMRFSPGSLFQPELLVIVTGSVFAYVVEHETLHRLEKIISGVWVFGQLILFSMMGSKTDIGVFFHLWQVLPLIFVGVSCRFVGMFFVTLVTKITQSCTCTNCRKRRFDTLLPDALFCFLSTLPRATIQSALGPVPLARQFFVSDNDRGHVRTFISVAARLYVVCMAIVGSILLDAIGPRMLKWAKEKAANREPCSRTMDASEAALLHKRTSGQPTDPALTCHQSQESHAVSDRTHAAHSDMSAEQVKASIDFVSERLQLPKGDVVRALRKIKDSPQRDNRGAEPQGPHGTTGNAAVQLPGANGRNDYAPITSPPALQLRGRSQSDLGPRLTALEVTEPRPSTIRRHSEAIVALGPFATDGSPGYSRERALSLSQFEISLPAPQRAAAAVRELSDISDDEDTEDDLAALLGDFQGFGQEEYPPI